jgi:uncharacterized membrane protein
MVTAARTASQIGVHMGVAFATLYLLTGSMTFGGIAAVVEPICNVIIMPLHDKLWEHIRERVDHGRGQARTAAAVTRKSAHYPA